MCLCQILFGCLLGIHFLFQATSSKGEAFKARTVKTSTALAKTGGGPVGKEGNNSVLTNIELRFKYFHLSYSNVIINFEYWSMPVYRGRDCDTFIIKYGS